MKYTQTFTYNLNIMFILQKRLISTLLSTYGKIIPYVNYIPQQPTLFQTLDYKIITFRQNNHLQKNDYSHANHINIISLIGI